MRGRLGGSVHLQGHRGAYRRRGEVSGATVAVIAEDAAEDGGFDGTARTSQDFPIAFRR
jgi:hypothetical protein